MMLKMCGVAILMAVVGAMLGELGFKGKRIFGVLCVVMLITGAVGGLGSIFGELGALSEMAGVSEISVAALKVVGAGYVFGVSADIASELGESGISSALGVLGKVEILAIVFPYFKKILEMGIELLK